MWKFQDLHVIQILRESILKDVEVLKRPSLPFFGALILVHLGNVSLGKVQKFIKPKFRASQCAKMAHFETLHLISRTGVFCHSGFT